MRSRTPTGRRGRTSFRELDGYSANWLKSNGKRVINKELNDEKKRFLQLSREDPAVFVEYAFGAKREPEPVLEQDNWQFDVLDAIREGKLWITIRSGHGTGKTTLLSWIILWFASTRGQYKIPCTANTESQLQDILWSELGKWLKKMPDWLSSRLELTTGYLRLKSSPKNAFATARTAKKEKPEALQGFHDDNMMFIVDEASAIDDIIFEVAQGSLSTPGALLVLTGNPTRASGYFKDSFGKNRAEFEPFTINGELVSRCSRTYIERIARQYGPDSDIYRIRVKGEFSESNSDAYIPLYLIEAAIDRKVEPIDVMPIWGLDPARYGNCATALTKRQGNVILEQTRLLYKRSTTDIAGWIVKQFKDEKPERRPSDIVVDSIGIGAGVADMLEEAIGDLCHIIMLNVSEKSYTPDCMKLRDYLYKECFEWFDSRNVKIFDDPVLISDFSVVRGKYDSQGRLKIESKDELIKRLGRSPDASDSFINTFAVTPQRRQRNRPERNANELPSSWVA